MYTKSSDNIRIATNRATAPHMFEAIQQRLSEQSSRLFVKEQDTELYLLNLQDDAEGV